MWGRARKITAGLRMKNFFSTKSSRAFNCIIKTKPQVLDAVNNDLSTFLSTPITNNFFMHAHARHWPLKCLNSISSRNCLNRKRNVFENALIRCKWQCQWLLMIKRARKKKLHKEYSFMHCNYNSITFFVFFVAVTYYFYNSIATLPRERVKKEKWSTKM